MTISAPEPPLDQPYYGAPMQAAFVRFWKKGLTFSGRASRSEFWWAFAATQGVVWVCLLLAIVIPIVAVTVALSAYDPAVTYSGPGDASGVTPLSFLEGLLLWGGILYGVAVIVPSIAISWRRLHDANMPGLLYFLYFVPYAGEVAYPILMSLRSNPDGARFDETSRPVVSERPSGGSHSYGLHGSSTAQGGSAGGGYVATSLGGDGFVSSAPAVSPPIPISLLVPPVPQPAATPAVPVPPVPVASLVPPVPQPPSVPPVPAPGGVPMAPAFGIPSLPAAAQQFGAPPVPAPARPEGPIQAIPGVVSTAPAVPPVPALPAPPVALAAPTGYAASPDDDLDSTRITPAARGQWHATLADGRQILIGPTLRVGRAPAADGTDPHAALVAIDDPAKSVSKTHAQLHVDGEGFLITDLHSTNGTIVRTAGTSVVLAPEHPYRVTGDADVQIGDYLIQVRRG